jgi:hypothetical protein
MKKFSVVTVKNYGPAPEFTPLGETNYEVPGVGQDAIKSFRQTLPKGSTTILRGFFVGEEKKFLPVNLNSI